MANAFWTGMKRTTGCSSLLRISLIMAILASLSVCGLALTQVKQKLRNLQKNLATETATRQKTEMDLAKARTDLATSIAALKEVRADLEATTLEKQRTSAVAAAQAKKATETLTTTSRQRDEAQANLARYQAAGMEPEQIVSVAKQLKALQNDLLVARKNNELLTRKVQRLASFHPEDGCTATLPADLKAKVIASDPKWHFIVLDAGEDQGVVEHGEVLVSRQGKLLAKAKVSRVHKDRCIANLVPGWEFAEVVEGDCASSMLAHF